MIFEGGSRSSTVMFINKVYNFLIAIHYYYYYYCVCVCVCVCVYDPCVLVYSIRGGELFEDIVHRDYYSEADARSVS